jgi:hypothetical protein
VLDVHQEYASGRYDFNPRIIVAAGISAMKYAGGTDAVIYAIPDINLFIPDNPNYSGLGGLVADLLREIYVIAQATEDEEVHQPEGTVDIDPRDAVLPPPKDPLTLEEVKKVFKERFPEDPYVFTSNGVQVGVYLNEPPGIMPIEFSLEEFYTILKLVEVTRAKTIRWRPLDKEEEDAISK